MRHLTLRSFGRHLSLGLTGLAVAGLVTSLVATPLPAAAREPDHTIRFKHLHTGETGSFTYKRNGRYDKAELAKINHLMRDWRKNQQVTIDPQLLDLIWGVYQQTGASGYINVVCGFRSPATNSMLRSRSRGVAQHSQHTLGKAIDFYIPGVPLAKLRAAAVKVQGGGVGYYPTSGSPFIHMDTGNVRAWPRMSRSQLLALFPNGNTLHLPADGKPLPGYERAVASRKAGGTTALAYLDAGDAKKSGGTWLKRVFSGPADQAEDDAEAGATTAAPASAPAPGSAAPATAAPLPGAPPVARPQFGGPEFDGPQFDGPEFDAAPQTEVATLQADPARVPRARPPSDAESAIAAISGLPGQPSPDDLPAIDPGATLAYAPLPRNRPSELTGLGAVAPDETLAASGVTEAAGETGDDADLADAAGVGAYGVGDDQADVLAALAARADAETPDPGAHPGPAASSSGMQVASLDPSVLSAAEPLVYTPAGESAPASPLASSGGTLGGETFTGETGTTTTDRVDVFLVAALEARAETKRAEIRALADPQAATSDDKTDRIRAAAAALAAAQAGNAAALAAAQAGDGAAPAAAQADTVVSLRGAQPAAEGGALSAAFAGFSKPRPADESALFSQPADATAVADPAGPPKLPADRFSHADLATSAAQGSDEPAPSGSFFSRLFASLAQ